jgi:hypothetical protein
MNSRPPRAGIRRTNETFDAPTANKEMSEKLRRDALRRRARTRGLELRQSSYGYALIDSERQRLDGRNDLTLDEVAARLK